MPQGAAILQDRSTGSGNNSKRALVSGLNQLLADAYTLYFKTKNFHWHVSGPQFRDYHLMLDEQATEILAITDPIAERVRKLGYPTLRSLGEVIGTRTLQESEQEGMDADAMLEELRRDTLSFVDSLKQVKELAGSAGDNATDELIDDWTDQAEERAWFLAETLGRRA